MKGSTALLLIFILGGGLFAVLIIGALLFIRPSQQTNTVDLNATSNIISGGNNSTMTVAGPGSVVIPPSPTANTPPTLGITTTKGDDPPNIPTTLTGADKRNFPKITAYVYPDGNIFQWPKQLDVPVSVTEIGGSRGPPLYTNELRGVTSTNQYLSLTIKSDPSFGTVIGVENDYYVNSPTNNKPLRLVATIGSVVAMGTSIIIYNYTEPGGGTVTVVPGANTTLVGSGDVIPANVVIFRVTSPGQLERISVGVLLKPA